MNPIQDRYVTHLLKLALGHADTDLPAVVHTLVHAWDPALLGSQVQVNIIREALDRQTLPVQENLRMRKAKASVR